MWMPDTIIPAAWIVFFVTGLCIRKACKDADRRKNSDPGHWQN